MHIPSIRKKKNIFFTDRTQDFKKNVFQKSDFVRLCLCCTLLFRSSVKSQEFKLIRKLIPQR